MARSAKRNEEMRETTRAAVLDSAMLLFAHKGYAGTSTRAIARGAGISTGLIYHYFSGKEVLLQAVFDHAMQQLGEAFATAYEAAPQGQRLAALLEVIHTRLERDSTYWSLFYMLRSQPAVMEVLGDDIREWTARLRSLFVEDFAQAGRNDPLLDAYLLYSLLEGTIQQYLLDPETYPLGDVVDRIIKQHATLDQSGGIE